MAIRLEPVTRLYVKQGHELPYDVFNSEGRLILSKGFVITDIQKMMRFVRAGMYRDQLQKRNIKPMILPPLKVDEKCPFNIIDNVYQQLELIYFTVINENAIIENLESELFKIASEIQRCHQIDIDATLAGILLSNPDLKTPYSVKHPVDTAIVATLIGKMIGFNDEELKLLITASLTMNLGLVDIHDQLTIQVEPLDAWQKERIANHPTASKSILENAGVKSKILLEAVRQHHEQQDGNGYPRKLAGNKISPFAQIVSVSDMYTAMLTDKAYRSGILPSNAMKELFVDRGQRIHEKLTKLFIKELGIYPPGTVVRLANLEVAVVLKRGFNSNCPHVVTILSPRGEPTLPIRRETTSNAYKITESLFPKETGMKLNRHMLWGYFDAYRSTNKQE